MSDNKSKTVADRKRINVHEDHELRYWSHRFGVSRDELKRTVSKVGVMPTMLLAHFVSPGCTQPRHPTMLPNDGDRMRESAVTREVQQGVVILRRKVGAFGVAPHIASQLRWIAFVSQLRTAASNAIHHL